LPEYFPTEVTSLVGTDGQTKMSKSLGNAILLSDDAKTVEKKVRGMYTDPKRVSADVPGSVEGNPVFTYHDIWNPQRDEVHDLKSRYREGKVGDVEVKNKLTVVLNNFLDPIREKRQSFDFKEVDRIIVRGTEKMIELSNQTLKEMKSAMGISGTWKKLLKSV